ncbi:Choline transport protein [Sphaceloma murrayae]|uniref:Choline transport protein n=1 Tax=Sphaceloma murrayae TaxID=2082308 RepID=A0A2K1QWP0_9PEZI|nr:Choline transport protein [Sphaceloma murrayae]
MSLSERKSYGADAAIDEHSSSPVEDGTFDGIRTAVSAYDKRDMHRMGKKQEFRRNFRLISTIGFTSANSQGLVAGGPPALFWSLVWCYTGQTFVVLSLAEMASMAPTAGGQYHWVSEFAPPRFQRSLSYLSGWLSTISWQSIVTIDCFLVGGIVQAMIVINNDTFVPERWQVTLLTMASVIILSLFNIFAAKHLPLFEGIFALLYVFAFVPIIAVLWVLCPVKQTASAVFSEFTDNGAGWPNMGATVLVGQLSSMFVVLGSDSVAHMSEEVLDAGVIVPKSMVWAFFLNMPFTFIFLVTYLFCIGDVASALSSPTGYPFVYVFQNAIGSASGTTGLVVIVEILLLMITASVIASASRQTFAFARDNGLPLASWLGTVHPRLKIPVNSIIFTIIFTMLLSLINIGSTTAFNALLSLAVTALMATYVISIGCVSLLRYRGEPLPPARWSLGRWGFTVNIIALLYATWSFFWSFWPNAYAVTPTNFNWASVLFVGFMLLALIAYWAGARKKYEGPVKKVVDVGSVHSLEERK